MMDIENMSVQNIQLELIKRASFHNFDGEMVVKSLKSNRHLWKAVVMDRPAFGQEYPICLIKLRDLPSNTWSVDTIYIIPEKGKEDELYELVSRWKPDEMAFLSEEISNEVLGIYGYDISVLYAWWD